MGVETVEIAEDLILEALFTSSARVAVLRTFLLDPSRPYYQRQLEAASGLPLRAIQRELDRLTSIELLYRRVEGNRVYYLIDPQFPLYPELRGMVLKTCSPVDALRGALAVDDHVDLAFYCETEGRVLVVNATGKRPGVSVPSSLTLEVMSRDAFARALQGAPEALEPFLRRGVDLLGRRDDVMWRRIESAGYHVAKGKGVP